MRQAPLPTTLKLFSNLVQYPAAQPSPCWNDVRISYRHGRVGAWFARCTSGMFRHPRQPVALAYSQSRPRFVPSGFEDTYPHLPQHRASIFHSSALFTPVPTSGWRLRLRRASAGALGLVGRFGSTLPQ